MTETNFRSEQQVESSQPETDAPTDRPLAPIAVATRDATAVTSTDVVFDLRDVDIFRSNSRHFVEPRRQGLKVR